MSPKRDARAGGGEQAVPAFPGDDLAVLAGELAHLDFGKVEINWPDYRVVITRRNANHSGQGEPDRDERCDTTVAATLAGTFAFETALRPDNGARLEEGQVFGTVRVLDTVTPLKSPRGGVVTRVCVSDGAFVEFGQVLFFLTPE